MYNGTGIVKPGYNKLMVIHVTNSSSPPMFMFVTYSDT